MKEHDKKILDWANRYGFNPDTQIAITWGIEDVKDVRPDLPDEQCMEVLQRVLNKHDAEHGITWDTLQITADFLFPQKENGDE